MLIVEEAERPVPGSGQVLIRAEAIGVNFVDVRFRRGGEGIFRRPLPGRPTGDVVGVVAEVGSGVDPALVGQRVAALAEDAYAEFAVAEASWLAAIPPGLGAGDAVMVPMAGPVALRVLRQADFRPGETVLVHSAAGGIGHLVVQLAKRLGAGLVIGAASRGKLDFVRSAGADLAVDYGLADWPERVREVVPGGVDVVLDAVGGQVLRQGLELLAPFGRAVIYGAASGTVDDIPAGPLFALRTVGGFNQTAWREVAPERARAEMDEVAELFAVGGLRTVGHVEFPLEEAAGAHKVMEEREHVGRVLLRP
ncbi:quinone oxidoreductase family protein [Actinoplanes ianthinogenes]|uniref:Oxidoreductase n=1 Tax=Actinoplanes ianthinogenes TaxID=122358 RepID=A0ABN6CNT5_9ACTN|nr:zinc-binding dehydrogenase [Actinoplanes ianthinogenes]BCJ46878.1 oxidoreductase [Actinoplanes ianthinogenes]